MIKRYITNIFKNKTYNLNNKIYYVDKIEIVMNNPLSVSKMNKKRNYIYESMIYITPFDI